MIVLYVKIMCICLSCRTWILVSFGSRVHKKLSNSIANINEKLPLNFREMFIQTSYRHSHETRQQSDQILYEYPIRTNAGRKCIRHLLPEIVNETQSCIREKVTTHSFNDFSICTKYMINNYSKHCHMENCHKCYKQNWASFHWLFLIPPILQYKTHQIPKLKYLSSHRKVVFAQSIEARC